jgi:hypothetical protein
VYQYNVPPGLASAVSAVDVLFWQKRTDAVATTGAAGRALTVIVIIVVGLSQPSTV